MSRLPRLREAYHGDPQEEVIVERERINGFARFPYRWVRLHQTTEEGARAVRRGFAREYERKASERLIRVVQVWRLLQSPIGRTVTELAEELGCHRVSIVNYLRILEGARVPLVHEVEDAPVGAKRFRYRVLSRGAR